MSGVNDGFTLDELLNIGTRKTVLDINISATDINRSLPYDISKMVSSQMEGHTEDELKDIGMRRSKGIALPTSDTNAPFRTTQDIQAVETVLDKLQTFLGIRTK